MEKVQKTEDQWREIWRIMCRVYKVPYDDRALDYLLSRREVDPKHVGITGNSGGGTMTTWLCGVEPRWTMAAPMPINPPVTTAVRPLKSS